MKNLVKSQSNSASKDISPTLKYHSTSLKKRDIGTITHLPKRDMAAGDNTPMNLNIDESLINSKRSIGTQIINNIVKNYACTQTEVLPKIIQVSKGSIIKPSTVDVGIMYEIKNKSIGTATSPHNIRNIGTITETTIENPVSLLELSNTIKFPIVRLNVGVQCNISFESVPITKTHIKSIGVQTTNSNEQKFNRSTQAAPIVSNNYSDTNDLIVCNESFTQIDKKRVNEIATNTYILHTQSIGCNTEPLVTEPLMSEPYQNTQTIGCNTEPLELNSFISEPYRNTQSIGCNTELLETKVEPLMTESYTICEGCHCAKKYSSSYLTPSELNFGSDNQIQTLNKDDFNEDFHENIHSDANNENENNICSLRYVQHRTMCLYYNIFSFLKFFRLCSS